MPHRCHMYLPAVDCSLLPYSHMDYLMPFKCIMRCSRMDFLLFSHVLLFHMDYLMPFSWIITCSHMDCLLFSHGLPAPLAWTDLCYYMACSLLPHGLLDALQFDHTLLSHGLLAVLCKSF